MTGGGGAGDGCPFDSGSDKHVRKIGFSDHRLCLWNKSCTCSPGRSFNMCPAFTDWKSGLEIFHEDLWSHRFILSTISSFKEERSICHYNTILEKHEKGRKKKVWLLTSGQSQSFTFDNEFSKVRDPWSPGGLRDAAVKVLIWPLDAVQLEQYHKAPVTQVLDRRTG